MATTMMSTTAVTDAGLGLSGDDDVTQRAAPSNVPQAYATDSMLPASSATKAAAGLERDGLGASKPASAPMHGGASVASADSGQRSSTVANTQATWDGEHDTTDVETTIRQFGTHPMMERIQQTLYDQLLQTHGRVSAEMRDKEADMKRTKAERQAVGVELYSMQQQLAR